MTRAELHLHRCPRCSAEVSTSLAHAVVYHRCPNVKGNVMTRWEAVVKAELVAV